MAGNVAVFYRGRVRRCQREGITVSQPKGVPTDWLVAHACEAQAGTGL